MKHYIISAACMSWAYNNNVNAPPDPIVVVTLKCGHQITGKYYNGNDQEPGALELETKSQHDAPHPRRYGRQLIALKEIASFMIVPYADPIYAEGW